MMSDEYRDEAVFITHHSSLITHPSLSWNFSRRPGEMEVSGGVSGMRG
jgi:hypothetical protein